MFGEGVSLGRSVGVGVGAGEMPAVGARLYDRIGYKWLILVSAAFTAAAWLLVPLVKIDEIDQKARQEADALAAVEAGALAPS